MDRCPIFFCQLDEELDCIDLRVIGPRSEPCGIYLPVRATPVQRGNGRFHRSRNLRMNQKRQSSSTQLFERTAQTALIDPRETIDPGVDHEAFESAHSGLG